MSRFHLIQRFLALTGVIVAIAAAIIAVPLIPSWDHATIRACAHGEHGGLVMGAMYAFAAGLGMAIVTFLIDSIVGIFSAAGRRSALGFSVILQVGLAVVLLVGVNWFSFMHYSRCDVTRDKAFTLKPETVAELKKLRADEKGDEASRTTVIVNKRKGGGRQSDKDADRYDIEAERKTVEKVKDLVDQLREIGPQLRVVVLDKEDEDYDAKLAKEAARFPNLEAALNAAPESSIFFCSGDHIQRMGFSEFYLLDKPGSKQANGGRGNLVLLNQGIEPFARRVLAVEEKRPRVGIAVIHEFLSTQSSAEGLAMPGLRRTLTDNGYDVRDIILKKWGEEEPKPAAFTFDELRLDQLEEDVAELSVALPTDKAEKERIEKLLKIMKEKSLDDINKELKEELRGRAFTEADRKLNLDRFEAALTYLASEIPQLEEEKRKAEEQLAVLMQKESVVEGRHISDIKAKAKRLFDDCDVLILPRVTLIDMMTNWRISPRVYKLDPAQVAAIRAFIRSGKPVFALFGPNNEPGNTPPDTGEADAVEALFRELGLVFADQTVLYNAERTAIAARRVNPLGGGRVVDPPALDLTGAGPSGYSTRGDLKANPLREAQKLLARSTGQRLDLVLRHPRPVYFTRRDGVEYQPEFLFTDAASWNESKPFSERGYTPRFDPPKATDPTKGTRDEERHGPFPVGVAVQTNVPPEWLDDKYTALRAAALVAAGTPNGEFGRLMAEGALSTDAYTHGDSKYKPVKVRLAAIGQGGVFTSSASDADHPDRVEARDELLLQTIDWLIGRDDRLPRSDKVWQYPRVDLTERENNWWRWGTFLGLPLLFAYLGFLVLMVRKMR